MTRQDFLKSAQKYLQYFKSRENDVESVIREKCNENDTDITAIIEFSKWIDNVALKRPENKSDDVLEFVVGPCVDSAEFWMDINKTVFYNGYIAGLAGIIKTLYISSDGKFYDHKHELIAGNEEEFFDFLLSVEYDFHPIIKESVYTVLREAGWYEGRCVDVTAFSNEQRNIVLSNAQLDFIREFSGITVNPYSERCRFLSIDEILDSMPIYNSEFKTDIDTHNHGEYLVTVVNTMDFPCYIDPNGILKARGIPLGRTAMECINHLVKNSYGWLFDIDEFNNDPIKPDQTHSDI